MSLITSPIMLDATGQQIAEALHRQNLLLDVIAKTGIEHTENLDEIHEIVRSGKAKDVFTVGDQIIVPWTDVATGREYSMPFDIVHIPDTVTLADGDEVPGMYLQMHYALPFGVQFSAPQAMQFYENGLTAGTYYFVVGAAYGSEVAEGDKFHFTLTHNIPAGGQLAASMRSDQAVSGWTASTYASPDATAAIETVAIESGEGGGTLIGTLLPSNSDALSLSRIGFGNNRWKYSAMRQFLNSAGGVGSWWTPQHNFDRPPAEALTKAGLLSGFADEFLSILKPTKVDTALNTVCDGGGTDTTYDLFFLPSLQQMHWVPQAADVEGETFDYWKEASLSADPLPTGSSNVFPHMRTFALENHNSAQYVRLRSAYRGTSYYVWSVTSTGYATGNYALNALRPAAVCAIC